MASPTTYPFALRLIGFSPEDEAAIEAMLAHSQERPFGYFRLPQDSLQDPDLFVANATEWKALVALSYLGPSDVRPALLVGAPDVALPYPHIERPLLDEALLAALDKLVEKRADALSRLEASDVVTVPERRRRDRLDLDLTDPSEYWSMRRQPLPGGVLVVDKNPALADYVCELLAKRGIAVNWTDDEANALAWCKRQKISMVIANTSTPDLDPYRLCRAIKTEVTERVTVIFLVGKSFTYDSQQARSAGCEGFLTKPLVNSHLVSALKKFLPQAL